MQASGATSIETTEATPYTRRVAENYKCGETQDRLRRASEYDSRKTNGMVLEVSRESAHPDLGFDNLVSETAAIRREMNEIDARPSMQKAERLDEDY